MILTACYVASSCYGFIFMAKENHMVDVKTIHVKNAFHIKYLYTALAEPLKSIIATNLKAQHCNDKFEPIMILSEAEANPVENVALK